MATLKNHAITRGERVKNYFSNKEQACKCCGKGRLSPSTLMRANRARHRAEIPFVTNCISRCDRHNDEVGGLANSSHLIDSDGYSRALDIHYPNSKVMYKTVAALMAEGFTRIGVYKTFIHADDDPRLPQEVMWVG